MLTTNIASSRPAVSCLDKRRGGAFTLVELLLVITIIVLVGSMIAGGLGVWSGRGVTTGGNLLVEDISFARELAVSTNRPAEIWFLRPHGTTPVVATQIYTIDDNGNATPYAEVHYLPNTAIIDSGATNLSPLLVPANQRSLQPAQVQPSIGTYGTNYDWWYIRFMPDASTTLSSNQQWYLTVHGKALGDMLSKLPPNYAVVSVDPMTGNVAMYQP